MTPPLTLKCSAISGDWRIHYLDQGAQKVYWAQQAVPPFRKTSMSTNLQEVVGWAQRGSSPDGPIWTGRDPLPLPPEAEQLSMF